LQALKYISTRMKVRRFVSSGPKKSPIDDVRDVLATTVLAHVPVENFNFKMKAIYLALMVRLYLILTRRMLRYATLRYATLRYATLRYATLRYATLRYATLNSVFSWKKFVKKYPQKTFQKIFR
jgi:uncharacterized protein YjbI with pentapeptide repeats